MYLDRVTQLALRRPQIYKRESGGNALSLSLYLPLVVSLTVLLALTVLLVNCVTCCKERAVNFKEFEDHFDHDEIDFTPPAEDTPSMQSPVEVYTLAVPPVALPGPPHLQPPPHTPEGSGGSLVARHSLSYIQEIGNGLFGKVLLSEIYTDPVVTRVVVKELNANASSKEQNSFLQQGDPYRVLQHPNILQCLGQCVEAIPFLLVFEYCEMHERSSPGIAVLIRPMDGAVVSCWSLAQRQTLWFSGLPAPAGGYYY
ncbi:hypothetical protein CRUP_027825 [Coryphaenoides rupestris]|nr:hypothetical protein CRUP_027825 [Coryphaenoides rupestris]